MYEIKTKVSEIYTVPDPHYGGEIICFHPSFWLILFTLVEVDHKQWKTHFTDLKKTLCTWSYDIKHEIKMQFSEIYTIPQQHCCDKRIYSHHYFWLIVFHDLR